MILGIIAKASDATCKTGGNASTALKLIDQIKKLTKSKKFTAKIAKACEPFFNDLKIGIHDHRAPDGIVATCARCFSAFAEYVGNLFTYTIAKELVQFH